MDDNIAQISRWWTANSIISQMVDMIPFLSAFQQVTTSFTSSSRHCDSSPFNLAPLSHDPVHLDGIRGTTLPSQYSSMPNDPIMLSPPTPTFTPEYAKMMPRYTPHTINKQPTDLPSSPTPCTTSKPPSQLHITQWTCHRPFIAQVTYGPTPSTHGPTNPRHEYTQHLKPFGAPLPEIDHTKILRVRMQNTQHSFQLYGDNIHMLNITYNLKSIGAFMSTPISPNVNWKNLSNWSRTHQIFRHLFNQVHLSAVSRNIGCEKEYINKTLIGGSALLTFGLWASKVSHYTQDNSGFGTFLITTIQGRGDKK